MRRRLTRGRRLLFAALTTTMAFALTEALLAGISAATGQDWRVDPLPAHEQYEVLCPYGDLLRLCPDQGPAYERVRPLVFSAAKDRPRVVAIGESFVFGLGLPAEQAWPARLQEELGAGVEVLNLGRSGTYASRLVPLVQAAITLDADVVVLATGNNEHTMTSFYSGWAGRHPLLVYRTGELLGRLRLYGLLAGRIGIPPRVEERFDQVPATFGEALDRQVYAARRRPPDLSAFHRPDLPEGWALAGPRVTEILEQEQRLKERIFRGHLEGMVRILDEAGVQVVLATLPLDLSARPVLSGVHGADEAEVVARLGRLAEEETPDREALAAALALDPRVAAFSYLDGMDRRARGDLAGAAAALWAAVEWDLVPDATPGINRITTEVAQAQGAPLVPLDQLCERWLTQPSAWMLDRVHLSEGGARAVAAEVAPVVRAALDERQASSL